MSLVIVGLLALLWGGDMLARAGAETLLEDNLQDVTGVVERPEVQIEGTLFLPQALRGAYRRVDVDVAGIQGGPLRVERVQSQLRDVRLPLRDVVLREIRPVPVGYSVDEVTLRFDDLNRYFDITGRDVRLEPVSADRLLLRGTFSVFGRTVAASAEVALAVDGSQLRIIPGPIDTGGTTLSDARRLLLQQRLSFTVPLDTLPLGRNLTSVTVVGDGLRLAAAGGPLVLRP